MIGLVSQAQQREEKDRIGSIRGCTAETNVVSSGVCEARNTITQKVPVPEQKAWYRDKQAGPEGEISSQKPNSQRATFSYLPPSRVKRFTDLRKERTETTKMAYLDLTI
ncbi:hypothetical protein BFJ68_g12228 [Fusarium oxysporum]|uniref:Uncharacterized protein n=1 Tax=Fusarium oxysporum TaxID=5507 RepID=A0A420Q9T8_FUSOX|nr:hypothetical protein BFJ68_g12228 [Fusarium oxysporum]